MARVRYFAAAAEFAGRDEEVRDEHDLAALRAAGALEYPGPGGILPRGAVLVDGRGTDGDTPLPGVHATDVPPPFAES